MEIETASELLSASQANAMTRESIEYLSFESIVASINEATNKGRLKIHLTGYITREDWDMLHGLGYDVWAHLSSGGATSIVDWTKPGIITDKMSAERFENQWGAK